jgi:hypothetical protein
MPPVGDLVVKELLEVRREPGGGVDAVGDGVDMHLREHGLRDLAVLHGHAVDVAREAQRQIGHVEQVVMQAAEALDDRGALMAEHLQHLVQAELVMAGGHGSVRGEDALLGDGVGVSSVAAESGAGLRRSSSRPMASREAWPSFMWHTSGWQPRACSR